MNTLINASLPVIIKVLQKTSFNRYALAFGTQMLSTRSLVPLDVGAEYYANIGSQNGGIININTLIKRENFECLADGANLLENILSNADISWLLAYIKRELAHPKNESEFKIFTKMLIALNSSVINIPFFYENRCSLAQIKLGSECEFYLLFSTFAPFVVKISQSEFTQIISPYRNFTKAIADALGCEGITAKVEPLWHEKQNLLDIKG